jgi:hydroxymethylpyrimidine pyrophosphatase-like HAD family hydrolase
MGVFYETEFGYVLDGQRYLPPEGRSEVERMENKGLRVEYNPDGQDFLFEKFITYVIPGCNRERFWMEASRDFELIDRGNGMIEAVLIGNNKATGITRILEHFCLTGEDAAAFGDSPNDLAMFSCVRNPVAMGGSATAVQEKAVYVTDTVLKDGIAKGLKWLCSGEQ